MIIDDIYEQGREESEALVERILAECGIGQPPVDVRAIAKKKGGSFSKKPPEELFCFRLCHLPLNSIERKCVSFLLRMGCRNFRSAFASIWRTRSRVTVKIFPTSSSVRG